MLINGTKAELVSGEDRGLLYGDGIFATIRIINGQPVLWSRHLSRLKDSGRALALNFDPSQIEADLTRFLSQSPLQGIVKIIITRGCGGRGYKPAPDLVATRIFQFHPVPENLDIYPSKGISVQICRQTLGLSTLAGHKHLNRLEQVLAALELDSASVEGLMLDINGQVIEGTRSNLFLSCSGQLCTPDLRLSGVAGVMRAQLLEFFRSLGQAVTVRSIALPELFAAEELFVCNSVFGTVPVTDLRHGEHHYQYSIGQFTRTAQSMKLAELTESLPR